MGMKNFKKLREIFSAKTGPGSGYISEEEALAEDVAELDRTNPGWDHESRVATAAYFLRDHRLAERTVTAVYGVDVVQEARKLNAHKPSEPKK